MIFLETERLRLRKFQETDFADFCEFAMDLEMCRMMGRANLSDTAAARLNFDWLMKKEDRGYCIVYKETGKVIGNLTVCSIPEYLKDQTVLEGKTGCSLSFSISRHYQRRGLMFEAVSAVIDHLFRVENMDYVNCGHFDFNIPSKMLQKKLGFTYLTTCRFQEGDQQITTIENILWRK